MDFTTAAYRREALKQFLTEANSVASQLGLPENLPIMETNLIHAFISPFGYAYMNGHTGNITTSNYWYGFERGSKFNELTRADYENLGKWYVRKYSIPANLVDTNAAFQLATQWLANISVDVAGLDRDCLAKSEISPEWIHFRKKAGITPIYVVSWMAKQRSIFHPGYIASVELFLPTKTLMALRITDEKYLLRKPLVRQNLELLFPGRANITTNYPMVPKVIPF